MRFLLLPLLLLLAPAHEAAEGGPADEATAAEDTLSPRAAVGWRLFTDKRLSRPEAVSCATCHRPETGFADGLERAQGVYGDVLPRHTPRLLNLARAGALFWDGRAASLEEQALSPLTHPLEMDLTAPEIVERVAADSAYRRAFQALGVEEIAIDDVTGALADFVRSLESGETAFDRWLAGDAEALSPPALRGRQLFFTRAQCATCHSGPDLSDHDLHNVATGTAEDLGRFAISGRDEDRGKFKTPSLQNLSGTEPFMHDGRYPTLEDVLDHYSQPPPDAVGTSELDPLDLSDRDKADLLAFLRSLDGPAPDLEPYEELWRQLAGD